MAMSDKNLQSKKRNALKYGVVGLIIVFLLYHSFYVVSLDSRAGDIAAGEAEQLVETYFSQTLPRALENAPAPCMLLDALSNNEDDSWAVYGKQTTIGNRYYFLMRGEGVVKAITDNYISVDFEGEDGGCTLRIATIYIFGNEIRDATGGLLLQDVGELTTFNAVSELINNKVRQEVVPDVVKQAEVGKKIRIDGAFALNKRVGITADFEVMPIQVQMID